MDNDCDGGIDEDASDALTWYLDSDTDGYGDASSTELSCTQPTGYVVNSEDCDDSSDVVSPDTVWYADADSDTYGSTLYTTTSCLQPNGYVADNTDCDDTQSSAYPTASEQVTKSTTTAMERLTKTQSTWPPGTWTTTKMDTGTSM